VAVASELWCLSEQTSSEPWAVTLAFVRDDLDLETARLSTAGTGLRGVNAGIDKMTDIALETTAEVFVEGGTTGEDDVLCGRSA
jgi:hypothetical protein